MPWITLNGVRDTYASIACPVCGFIAHIEGVTDRNHREPEILLLCEKYHYFKLKFQDHSGALSMTCEAPILEIMDPVDES
jgi:hypothetical protein